MLWTIIFWCLSTWFGCGLLAILFAIFWDWCTGEILLATYEKGDWVITLIVIILGPLALAWLLYYFWEAEIKALKEPGKEEKKGV